MTWTVLPSGQAFIQSLVARVRAVGPLAFFIVMAVIPAPLAWFTIPAGEAFAGELTLPGVIIASLASVAVQISLCYALARSVFRNALLGWLTRRGYAVPQVRPDNALSVVLLVRLVPGPPLSSQCFLLGLAGVPFRTYITASWLMTVPWVIGGVVFGRGILHGNLALGIMGLCLLGAAMLAFRLARRRWAAPFDKLRVVDPIRRAQGR
jgi:uncharacterized membrane protein YdjX (TVP38/TMEM64 family)